MNAADTLARAIRTVPDFPKPGILFKDVTPVLADARLLRVAAEALAGPFRDAGITHVAGIEARGFMLGGLLADLLGAGFVPVRKRGKLPWRTYAETYALEYGTDTLELHEDAAGPGARVLVHDDVIATGGTAAAAANLVRRTGAEVAGFAFLFEIAALGGRKLLGEGVPVHYVLEG